MSRHLHLGRFQSILIAFENALQNRKCKRTLSHFRQDFVLQIWPSPLETAEGGKVDLAGLKPQWTRPSASFTTDIPTYVKAAETRARARSRPPAISTRTTSGQRAGWKSTYRKVPRKRALANKVLS